VNLEEERSSQWGGVIKIPNFMKPDMRENLLYTLMFLFATCTSYSQELQAEQSEKVVVIDGDTINYYPEVSPTFPGGQPAIDKYFLQHLPDFSRTKSKKYDKNIWVSFVIRSSGRIGLTNIISSDKPGLNEKLNHALKSMPAWNPAVHQGKKVATIGDFNFYFD
jgi:hypothetical protein